VDVIDRGFPRTEGIPKGFDRDVDSDFVPVLEAIGHGLRHAVDMHQNTLDLVLLNSLGQGTTREPHYAKCGRLNGRLMGFKVDRNPNLVWILGCKAVEPKCRQKANDAVRDEFCDNSKTVMFRDRRFCESVDTACRANEAPLPVEPKQRLPCDPTSFDIARTDQRLVSCEFENALRRSFRHVSFRRYFLISTEITQPFDKPSN
jgi:hypothetical protein